VATDLLTSTAVGETDDKKPRPKRWRRYLLRAFLASILVVAGLWIAAHRFPVVGSTLADGLRAVIGTERVSRLQDFVYGLRDRYNRATRSDEAPKAYWDVPPPVIPTVTATATSTGPPPIVFSPKDVGPVHKGLKAEGDGVWVPVPDPVGAAPVMYKTLLHPDAKRPWAEMFVVALDLRQIDLSWKLGTGEPRATTAEGRKVQRRGLIPTGEQPQLIAGFNGGFKLQHGRWGAGLGAATVVRPRVHGCTVAKTKDGKLLIDRWPDIEPLQPELVWWRQTPPCMFHDGKRHGALWDPNAKGWGATLEGGTVIRRSAIGLSPDRQTLFVGVTNDTAAYVLADGMNHAGANQVAQLDVNWSYPRFVVFPIEGGLRKTKSLFEGFEVKEDAYLRSPMHRDFFYVTRRPPG